MFCLTYAYVDLLLSAIQNPHECHLIVSEEGHCIYGGQHTLSYHTLSNSIMGRNEFQATQASTRCTVYTIS